MLMFRVVVMRGPVVARGGKSPVPVAPDVAIAARVWPAVAGPRVTPAPASAHACPPAWPSNLAVDQRPTSPKRSEADIHTGSRHSSRIIGTDAPCRRMLAIEDRWLEVVNPLPLLHSGGGAELTHSAS